MMVIDNKFEIGQTVYLKTDEKARMVTHLSIHKNSIVYCLSCGKDESYHEDFEISTEKDITVLTNN